jgi:hypothetical protein
MANNFPISPVISVPQTAIANPTDGLVAGSNYTQLREAAFINLWVVGPSAMVQVPFITGLRYTESYEDFQLVPTAGTFYRTPKIGSRIYNGTITRYQTVYNTMKAMVRAAYAAQQNGDIRLDKMPVQLLISYELAGYSGVNQGSQLAEEKWGFDRVYFTSIDNNLVGSATSASEETISFITTGESYNATVPGIQLISQPQLPAGLGFGTLR